MPTARKIVIHIGTEKTGTTSLQEFLSSNRLALLKQGFAYLTSLGHINHIKLCGLAQAQPPKFPTIDNILGITNEAARGDFIKTTTLALNAEIDSLPGEIHTILLSNEHLHSNLIEGADIHRLRDVLSGYAREFQIVAYIRRQDELAASLFSTRIKGGENWRTSIFPIVQDGAPPYYFNYAALLSNYETAFTHRAMKVRIFEKLRLREGDVVRDFANIAGISINDGFKPVARSNESLSYAGLYTLALLNKHFPPWIDGRWNQNRDHLVEILEQHYGRREPLTSRPEARQFYRKFQATNETIRQKFFPGQPTLFSEDFSRYPETIQLPVPSLEETAAVFACLWTERIKRAQANLARSMAKKK